MADLGRRAFPRLRLAVAATLAMTALSFLAPNAKTQIAGASGGGAARIWFYRDNSLYVSHNYATVRINGAVAGSLDPYGGSLYRDVAAGRYHLTVDSYGTDTHQNVDLDLAPSQQVFVKILDSPDWASASDDMSSFQRDTYYLRVMPEQVAQTEMSQRRF